MHRIIPVQDGMRWNPIWLRQQMLRKMFKHSAERRASCTGSCCRTNHAREKHILFPQLLQHCRVARQDTWPCCRRLWKKHKSASYSAREKSGNFAANIWQKTTGRDLSAYKAHKKRPPSTEPLTIVSADRTTGLLHRILLRNFAATIWPKKAGRDLSAYKAKNKLSVYMELLTIFFAKRTKGLLLHRILLLHKPRTETMYNFPATATTLPHCGLCFRLLWKNANELSIRFGWLSHGKKWELCREYLAKEAGRDLLAYKAKNKLSVHGSIDDCSADRVKNLLHKGLLQRILLPHTRRAKESTCLPQLLQHCRVARRDTWLHTSVEKAQMSIYIQSKQKPFFTRNPWRLFAQTKRRACYGLLHRILLPQRNRWRFYPQTERRASCTGSCCHHARKKSHFSRNSRNCYNIAAVRDRILGCICLWKKYNELLQTKQKVFFTRNRWRFCCRTRNEGPAAQNLVAATELLAILSADLTQGLLHRILLPHTPRAGKMHISPATVTTLPHSRTGYIPSCIRLWKKHK